MTVYKIELVEKKEGNASVYKVHEKKKKDKQEQLVLCVP